MTKAGDTKRRSSFYMNLVSVSLATFSKNNNIEGIRISDDRELVENATSYNDAHE